LNHNAQFNLNENGQFTGPYL